MYIWSVIVAIGASLLHVVVFDVRFHMYVCIYSQAHLVPEHENKFLLNITN